MLYHKPFLWFLWVHTAALVCCWMIWTTSKTSIAWTTPVHPPQRGHPVRTLLVQSLNEDEWNILTSDASSKRVIDNDDEITAASVSSPSISTKRRLIQTRPMRRTTGTSSSSSTSTSNANGLLNQKQLERKNQVEKAQERYIEALKDPTLFTNNTTTTSNSGNYFDSVQPEISSATKRAIQEVALLQQMTEIQFRTYPLAVNGTSLLGRARTGTGKTIAFLLPAIERLLKMDPKVFRPGRTIGIILMAPTRELVIQLSQEATKLLTFHHGYSVQPLYGGISIQRDRAILYHRPIPTILISTPGRLYDLLRESSSFRVHGNRNFIDVVNECPIVIFDEADRLMEGFMTEINTISSYLPRIEKRQTMLFSATISNKLKQVLHMGHPKILPNDYVTIDCVNEDDVTTITNQRVTQTFVQLTDMTLYVSAFLSIVETLMKNGSTPLKDKTSKVIIFLPTAKLVKFFTEVLHHISASSAPAYDVYSIHSRMSQGSRIRASTQFRAANTNCILLSSDVSARGVDYPDVTLVVQYGAPYNDELYLHRLGRTGRAGQVGNGLLVLLPFETRFLSKYRKYNILENTNEFHHINDPNSELDLVLGVIQSAVRVGHVVLTPSAEAAYISFVAHYIEYSRDNIKQSGSSVVLNAAEKLAQSFGLPSLPKLPDNLQSKIITKKGL